MPRGNLKSSLLLVGTLGMVEVPEEAAPRTAAIATRPAPPTEGIAKVVFAGSAAPAELDDPSKQA